MQIQDQGSGGNGNVKKTAGNVAFVAIPDVLPTSHQAKILYSRYLATGVLGYT